MCGTHSRESPEPTPRGTGSASPIDPHRGLAREPLPPSQAGTTRGDGALVAADDGAVLPSSQDRLDEAEAAQVPLEGIELVVVIRRGGSPEGAIQQAVFPQVRDNGAKTLRRARCAVHGETPTRVEVTGRDLKSLQWKVYGAVRRA